MQASFWLTSACNLSCIYCYEGEKKEKEIMQKRIIDQAIQLIIGTMEKMNDNCLWIVLHGGEPFLAFENMKYLVEKAKACVKEHKFFITFSCTTNATVLNEEMMKFIQREIDDFTISMDGKEETQNYSRPYANGTGTFSVVEKKLKEMLSIKPDLRVRMTYNHKTVYKLYENVQYFANLGVQCIVPVYDFFDRNFTTEEMTVLNSEIKKICKAFKKNEEILNNWKLKRLGGCSGGVTSLHIDSQGNIFPCMLAVGNNEFIIGDVDDGIDCKKRDEFLAYSKIKNRDCSGCALYEFCNESRCKIINKIINGEYTKPSTMGCAMTRVKYNICKATF